MKKLIFVIIPLIYGFVNGQSLAEAQNYTDHSDYRQAIKLYKSIQLKAQKNNDVSLEVEAKNGIASCYMELSANYKAQSILKENIQLLTESQSRDFLLFAKTHRLLADNYSNLYRLEDYFKECNIFYKYYQKSGNGKEIYKALYFAYLGRYYNLRFIIDKSNYYTSNALRIYHRNKKERHLIDEYLLYAAHAFTTRNLDKKNKEEHFKYHDSILYYFNKRYPYENLKKAKILVSVAAIQLDNAANNLYNTDTIKLQLGTYHADKAIELYNQAIKINDRFAGFYHSNSAFLCTLKGLMYFYKKNYNEALICYDEGIKRLTVSDDFSQKGFNNNNNIMLGLLSWKAWCLDDMYKNNKNKSLLFQSNKTLLMMEKVWQRHLSEIIRSKQHYNTNHYSNSPYPNLVKNYYELYKVTGKQVYKKKLFEFDEKSKYSALLESLYKEKNQILNSKTSDHELISLYTSFEEVMLKINSVVDNTTELKSLQLDFKSVYEQFKQGESKTEFDKLNQLASLSLIQQKLKKNEAIISYTLAGNQKKYYPFAILITQNNTQIIPFKEEPYFDSVKNRSDSIIIALRNNRIEDYKKLAHAYYKNYFLPVESRLPETVNSIQVIPNADFSNIPFDVLLTKLTGGNDYRKLSYLGKQYSFSYGLSVSIANLIDKTKPKTNQFSVFTPRFSRDHLKQLNNSQKTGVFISQEYQATHIKGRLAVRNAFQEHLQNDKIVAVMSHAKGDNDFSENNKGIYLSDGFLSLNEIYKMQSASDLLILGACETGVGFSGAKEGNINLARAFSSIGVKSMLLSSWRIDEMSSLLIIKSFLYNLSLGDSKSEALQKAKLDFLTKSGPRTANPMYWAGLNITGNNNPIAIKKSYNFLEWSLALVLPILTVLFWYYKKSKS